MMSRTLCVFGQSLPKVPFRIALTWWVQLMMDFHACRWPAPHLNALDESLAQYFDEMNDGPLSSVLDLLDQSSGRNGDSVEKGPERPVVITFSHFLPYQVGYLPISPSHVLRPLWNESMRHYSVSNLG